MEQQRCEKWRWLLFSWSCVASLSLAGTICSSVRCGRPGSDGWRADTSLLPPPASTGSTFPRTRATRSSMRSCSRPSRRPVALLWNDPPSLSQTLFILLSARKPFLPSAKTQEMLEIQETFPFLH